MPAPDHVFAALQQHAKRAPDHPALVFRGGAWSYRELHEAAITLASELAASVAPGERVALVLPNGPELVAGAFAIWAAGAIAVPLHVKFQPPEIARCWDDCRIRAALISVGVQRALKEHGTELDPAFVWSAAPDRRGLSRAVALDGTTRAVALDASMPALTQYSTGSSGEPRRITRTHAQIIAEARSVGAALAIGPSDRVLAVAPLFHSYGLFNALLAPIVAGATVITAEEFFTRDVAKLIESERVTGLPLVPLMLELLAQQTKYGKNATLRYCTSAGAPLTEAVAAAFFERYGIPPNQLYGSTETGVVSINLGDAARTEPTSVGPPIGGVAIEIVDEAGRPVPAGEIGEVAIRSRFAAGGYDRVPEASDSRFEAGRFFPGDLGSLSADGRLRLRGRRRQFINSAGNKVDPAEVEAVLRTYAPLIDVAVLGVPDGAGGERVKAVVVVRGPRDREALFAHARQQLAPHKLPRIIEFRDALPRNTLGKLLRKDLLEPPSDPRAGVAGLTPLLRSLAVTDGTVTRFLEAYLAEPIAVTVKTHESLRCDAPLSLVAADAGDRVLHREVLLSGASAETPYAYAETWMSLEAIDDAFRAELIEARLGIGEVIGRRRLETFREIVSIERDRSGAWAAVLGLGGSDEVLTRKYVIHHGGRAAILVEEVFAIARLTERAARAQPTESRD